jgi:hypothetical protein
VDIEERIKQLSCKGAVGSDSFRIAGNRVEINGQKARNVEFHFHSNHREVVVMTSLGNLHFTIENGRPVEVVFRNQTAVLSA